MEKLIVYAIGLAAFSYLAYKLWRNLSGQTSCDCSSRSSCCQSGGCCAKPPAAPHK